MAVPDPEKVLALKNSEPELSNRAIAKRLHMSATSVHRIIREAGQDGGPGTDAGPAILATTRQRTARLSPLLELIHAAAVQQLPGLRGVSFENFIFFCCDFVKDYFHLQPPGWTVKPTFEVDLTEDPGWRLPQVLAYVEKMEREAHYAEGEPVAPGSQEPEHPPSGGQSGDEPDLGPSGE